MGNHLSDDILRSVVLLINSSIPQTPDFHCLATLIYACIYILKEWGRLVPNRIPHLAVVSEGLTSPPREAGLPIPPDGRTMNQ